MSKRNLQAIILASILSLSFSTLADEGLIETYGNLPVIRSLEISPDGKHYAFIRRQEDRQFFGLIV
ncbi:MAG: hypothetical protein AAF513_15905, partial [Pseudomonadota bacterium]